MAGRTGPRRSWIAGRLYALKRWMYRGGQPGRLARAMIRLDVAQFSAGVLSPRRAVILEVPGRRSGRLVRVPVVLTEFEGASYLVSMLGNEANWVRNVRAAGGHAVLHRRWRQPVLLEEVEVGAPAPILRRYLELAPGARAHVPVDRHAPLAAFVEVAARHPVFRVTPVPADPVETGGTARGERE